MERRPPTLIHPRHIDRTPASASVTKNSALIASTTAPPLGTSRRLEMNSPPTPAIIASAMLSTR